MAGLPRAFALAVELITSTDGLLDVASLRRFLEAYQAVTPLTIGELWAVPIALRHAFLDRLAQIAARVEHARSEREAASQLAAELAVIAAQGADQVEPALAQRVSRRLAPSTSTFATELLLRLRNQDPALVPAAAWLERRIHAQGATFEEAIRLDHQEQATNQLSVGNALTSLRLITATDWSRVFESLSLVEEALRRDPSGDYAQMDFATRDRYRHAIERMAKRGTVDELGVACRAVELAEQARRPGTAAQRETHVGFYLVDHEAGVRALERSVGYRSPATERVRRHVLDRPGPFYLASIALLALAGAAGMAGLGALLGASPLSRLLLAALALLPASGVAVALVNVVVTALLPPRLLAKLDFSDGIPQACRTFVVVPTMLTSLEGVAQLLDALEVRYLANADPRLHFALLTDFTDATEATAPLDGALLLAARAGIERLNNVHGADRFYLFHRDRVWAPAEGAFIGWERKRGKLDAFNRLLLGEPSTGFTTIVGERAVFPAIRFIVTLDSDTQLPRDAAARLVGALAHPLNVPVLDSEGRVVAGYAILQPRISVALESSRRSRFSRLESDQVGIDPYTSAASDVYQDLFGEGSFVGKGIYDLRALSSALRGRIPEETVLSHDLLEGLLAHSGLLSDVELFDDTPSSFLANSLRRHRWIRGDWQIAAWLRAVVPMGQGASTPSRLSSLSRWKILDNLRRSWVPQASLLLLGVGWMVCARPLLWTASILLLLALPLFVHWLTSLLRLPDAAPGRLRLRPLWRGTLPHLVRSLLTALFLPHDAWVGVDATVRALYRKLVSHRLLLQWVTAAQAEGSGWRGPPSFYAAMAPSLVLALLLTATTAAVAQSKLAVVLAGVFLVLWTLAPLVAWWLSQPGLAVARPVTAVERYFLRRTARKTWSYFERFTIAADHFLPPDNYQEDRACEVAHRTSPTNIGLALLANFTALDLGYLGLTDCVERLERTLATLAELERHQGHFFNWYDTETLAPLLPRYVSTVDSGNLAAMLIAVKEGCLQARLPRAPGPQLFDGLVDTLRLIDEATRELGLLAARPLHRTLNRLEVLIDDRPASPSEMAACLSALRGVAGQLVEEVRAAVGADPPAARLELSRWSERLCAQIDSHRRDLHEGDPEGQPAEAALHHRLSLLAAQAAALCDDMDFRFLYDPERKVFSIGFDCQGGRTDASFYDLLASEARLASFVAIAKGDVPVGHWYRMGRPLVQSGPDRALLSWTGSMFEYLMPQLLLRSYPGTLLTESCRAAVRRQIRYAKDRHIPWGISESAYNGRDLRLDYQYGPFGIPDLGLRSAISDELVVAPYATALALLIDPHAAVENLWRLGAQGLDGTFGFYDSIDYTSRRVPSGRRGIVVRTFMAHHQGMSLLAIGEYLGNGPMRARFHADPSVRATELLLQERVPYEAVVESPTERQKRRGRAVQPAAHDAWHVFSPDAPAAVHLLSNGSYSVMVTSAGGGYSRCGGLAVTRWREDPTVDGHGQFFYVRDLDPERRRTAGADGHDAHCWTSAYQPTLDRASANGFCFSIDKAEYRQVHDGLEVHTAISVSTEDDAEIRTLTVTNQGDRPRDLDVTSYCEVVLASQAADLAHPAFSNLVVQTEFVAAHGALLATRRKRAGGEAELWAVHVLCVEGDGPRDLEYESDRARFIGRGQSPRHPVAQAAPPDQPLSGTTGAVLDPIFSLRRRIHVDAGKSVRLIYSTAVAPSRQSALGLAAKYSAPALADRASALAWTQAQAQLHYLAIDADEARTFLRLAAPLLYSSPQLRATDDVIAGNRRGQSGLWAYGISGDLPILLLRVDSDAHLELVREVLIAHEYLRLRGLTLDLVILNEHSPSYLQSFQDQVLALARSALGSASIDRPGGIFVRRTDLMPAEDQTLLAAVARAILIGGRGTISEQLTRRVRRSPQLPPHLVHPSEGRLAALSRWLTPFESARLESAPTPPALAARPGGPLGGFSPDGSEYVLSLGEGQWTPAPWSNVMANPHFGSLVTESGGGYEWSENCHDNRLTRWSNDPVCDPATTTLYLRDDDSAEFWSATPLPIRAAERWTVRHGQGYSVFESTISGIHHELRLFVHPVDPVKIARLTLRNLTDAARHLTVTGYVEWTLGTNREQSAPQVVTSIDPASGAFLARGGYPLESGQKVAFVDSHPPFTAFSGDRAEFLGQNGDPTRPAAMGRAGLSGRVGAGYDPCAAVQVAVTLEAGEEQEVAITLGHASDTTEARALIARYRQPQATSLAEDAVHQHWDAVLGAIEVQTPDTALDTMVNRWLLYQVMSCRLWARTGFYQSGGAYGFRDQLQDVSALVYSRPGLAREHLVRAASRQFPQGDVQHWWHAPRGQGVRTRFVDDAVWLPLIAAHYVAVTSDAALLDESIPFIEARALEEGEADAYLLPTVSEERASLYEHCARALDRSLGVGPHGLPLMGGGDWNDGMNRVGAGGQGESIWMGWLLIDTLEKFLPWCVARNELQRVARYRDFVASIKVALERDGWDGQWYRRAFFDDGTPLGSTQSEQCRIDSIAQSWSVICGAGDPGRAAAAVAAADDRLVDGGEHLIKLLAPPFDHPAHDPGYIQGYPPGVRENGGQYSHAAAWLALAHCRLGNGDRAAELLAMLNPVVRAASEPAAALYRVEPYVVAGDVSTISPHAGRGGWTWYTGAASWFYRVAVESLLGLGVRGDVLTLSPCIPRHWPGFSLTYRRGRTTYRFSVDNAAGVCRGVASCHLDGAPAAPAGITFVDDGALHEVRVVLGQGQPARQSGEASPSPEDGLIEVRRPVRRGG